MLSFAISFPLRCFHHFRHDYAAHESRSVRPNATIRGPAVPEDKVPSPRSGSLYGDCLGHSCGRSVLLGRLGLGCRGKQVLGEPEVDQWLHGLDFLVCNEIKQLAYVDEVDEASI